MLEKYMKPFLLRSLLIIATLVVLFASEKSVFAQTANSIENLSGDKIVEKVAPSVVMILTGNGAGILDKLGSGVIVTNDGVILTAYHVVKGATQLQIRLKNGEIYDKVDLIGYDERRDVAAIKIAATNLPLAKISPDESKIGGKVFVISNPNSLGWTVADGMLSALRMADDIPNAGHGFRVLQFSAPVSAGSSGGLLTDEKGQAIGLIVATLSSGQNLNFAIPLSSVDGMINSSQILMSFGKGNSLELPQNVRPPSAVDIVNADPKEILRNARIFYISSNSELISEKMMEAALQKMPEFEKWKLAIVNGWDKRDNSDIDLNVEHQLFTFDYRFTMTDRRTGIVLATGKVTVWDGNLASDKFAKQIIAKLKELREPETDSDKKDKKKKSED
jgi:S1-C subfamily serine protease